MWLSTSSVISVIFIDTVFTTTTMSMAGPQATGTGASSGQGDGKLRRLSLVKPKLATMTSPTSESPSAGDRVGGCIFCMFVLYFSFTICFCWWW